MIFVTDGKELAAYNWTFKSTGLGASTGWIGMTGVHPLYRGHGLGRAVVLAGMRHMTARGVRTIDLEVNDENIAAKEVYESVGFRVVWHAPWYEKSLGR